MKTQINFPFYGRLAVDGTNRMVVENSIDTDGVLPKKNVPFNIQIGIEVGPVKLNQNLVPMLGEIVKVEPNSKKNGWLVSHRNSQGVRQSYPNNGF